MSTPETSRARAALLASLSSTVALGMLTGLGGCAGASNSVATSTASPAEATDPVPADEAPADASTTHARLIAAADPAPIRQVGEASVLESALRVGDRAPDFELPKAGGGTLRLSDALADGPVVVTWYRGGWCPSCTRQLAAYSRSRDDFAARGATVIAIGPEVLDAATGTAATHEVAFPVLSDRGNRVAHAYGVGYRMPESLVRRYAGRLDLPAVNGDDSWTLPLSVTYVIDRDRTIRWAFIDPDTSKRASTDDLLAALDAVNASPDAAPATPEVASLRAQLEARKAAFTAAAPAEVSAVYESGIREVRGSAVMETARRVGDRAPDFELPQAGGGTLRLSDALQDGPVVLTWYRGGWCPYCTIQLKAYADALGEFRARGANVIAIGPEVEASAVATSDDHALPYPVLSDRGNEVAAAFGVGYRLPTSVIEQFTGRLDIPGSNGDDSWTLPLSVTYVIDRDRTIRWAFIDADYRTRAETADLLAALDAMNAG